MSAAPPAPKVSVCVVSYNQRTLIGATLDSLIRQDCKFPYEIIVSDDASTDGTADVVRQYAQAHPGLVVALLQPKNLGASENLVAVHNAARGQYIAHMDGDDLAYPEKLRRQAEVLDQNPDIAVVAHDCDVMSNQGVRLEGSYHPGFPRIADLDYLVRRGGSYFLPSSEMYRARCRRTASADGRDLLDYYFHVEHAACGKIAWLPDRLGAYRLNAGVSSNKALARRIAAATEVVFDHALKLGADPKAVRQGRIRANYFTAVKYLKSGDVEGFRRHIRLRPREAMHASWRHVALSALRGSDLALRLALKTGTVRRPVEDRPDPGR